MLPAALLMALLGWVHVRFGQVPLIAGALSGVQAAVLALWFGWQLLSTSSVAAALVIVPIAVLAWLGLARWRWNIVWIVLGAGLAGALVRAAGLAM